MSFRTEEKMMFHSSDFLDLKKFIFSINGKKLYPSRLIESIYFDNKYLQSYNESEEGTLPRKKIRIRSYDNFVSQNLEFKTTSVEGKFKKTKKLNFNTFTQYKKNGFFDNDYGLTYPISKVRYLRHYFSINNKIRLTIDQNITYMSYLYKSLLYNDFDSLILETKSPDKNLFQKLDNIIPFNKLRVSKYCLSI